MHLHKSNLLNTPTFTWHILNSSRIIFSIYIKIRQKNLTAKVYLCLGANSVTDRKVQRKIIFKVWFFPCKFTTCNEDQHNTVYSCDIKFDDSEKSCYNVECDCCGNANCNLQKDAIGNCTDRLVLHQIYYCSNHYIVCSLTHNGST